MLSVIQNFTNINKRTLSFHISEPSLINLGTDCPFTIHNFRVSGIKTLQANATIKHKYIHMNKHRNISYMAPRVMTRVKKNFEFAK